MSYKKLFGVYISFIKPKIIPYTVGLVGDSTVQAAFSIIMALVFKDMINAAIKGNIHLLARTSIFIGVMVFILTLVVPFFSYLYNMSVKLSMADLRVKLFEHIQKLPISFFENMNFGDVMTRMTSDVNVVENAYSGSIRTMLFTLIRTVGSTISILILDWRIAIIIIFLGICFTLLNTRYAKSIGKISDKVEQEMANLTAQLSNIYSGFRVTRIFNLTNMMNDHYKKINSEVARYSIKRSQKSSMLESTNFLLNFFNFLGVLVIGAFIAFRESTDFGTFIAIIQLQTGVTSVFLQIGGLMSQLQDSFAGAKRIKNLFETESEPETLNLKDNGFSDKMIELKDIFMEYEENNPVLQGVNLSVERGQFVALVGPSGGGKSTIVKILQGFYPIKSGSIVLNSKPASAYTTKQIRDMIAYIPQQVILFNGTIRENIKYGNPQATEEQIIATCKAANAHDFIMEQPQGYDTEVGELGNRLSGGQKQRLAIARAFLKNAPILILDEATSALDSKNEQLVKEALASLAKDRTIIMIAHRMSTILSADMIYVVSGGRIVGNGNHDQLLQENGLYKELFDLQFKS